MKSRSILQYPVGLGSILNSVDKHKGKTSAGAIVLVETINAVASGEVLLPEVPFSIEPMFNSSETFDISSNLKNKEIKLGVEMEQLVSKTKKLNENSKQKITQLFEISSAEVGGSYMVKLTDIENGYTEFVDLRRPDLRIYLANYAPNREELEFQIKERGSAKNLIEEDFRPTYNRLLAHRITTISDQTSYNKAILAVNQLTFCAPIFREHETYFDVRDYITALIKLIDASRLYRPHIAIGDYEVWKTQKLHFIGENIAFALPQKESVQLSRTCTGQIVHDHRDLFTQAINDYNKRMEEKNNTNGSPSFKVSEDLAELEKQQKKLEELHLIGTNIDIAKKEAMTEVKEQLNSVIGRCNLMSSKIGQTLTDTKNVIKQLNVGSNYKQSLILGISSAGAILLAFMLNHQVRSHILGLTKKILFGSMTNVGSETPNVVKEHFSEKITEKITEKIIDNTLKDNAIAGVTAVTLSKLAEKVLKYVRK